MSQYGSWIIGPTPQQHMKLRRKSNMLSYFVSDLISTMLLGRLPVCTGKK